jgi:hypothetical protein
VTSENRHHELLMILTIAAAEHREAIRGGSSGRARGGSCRQSTRRSRSSARGAGGSVAEVRRNAFHPLRKRFDEVVSQFIERLRSSPEVAARADALKDQFLNSGHRGVRGRLWESIRKAARYARTRAHLSLTRWPLASPQRATPALQRGAAGRLMSSSPIRSRAAPKAPGPDRGPGRVDGGSVDPEVAKRLNSRSEAISSSSGSTGRSWAGWSD